MNSEGSKEELTYFHAKIKRLRMLLIIFTALLAFALIAIVIMAAGDTNKHSSKLSGAKASLSLEDLVSGKLNVKKFNGSWTDGSNILYKNVKGHLQKYDVAEHKKIILINNERVNSYDTYGLSGDGKYLLLAKNHIKLFRHSFLAQYHILNLETGVITELKINNSQKYLLLAIWSPVGNALIINYERNLFYKSSVLAREVKLTNDQYFNGIPDWVYEEEVFSSNSAVWFSPNGKKIAYIQFDDTQTSIINIPFYGESGKIEFQYPKNKPISYPKAGAINPFVRLFYINLSDEHLNAYQIQVPSELNTSEHIITVVKWLDNEKLLSVWMNRIQNLAFIQLNINQDRYDLYRQESKSGWVDLFSEPLKNSDGSKIAIILPHKQSESLGKYRHLSILSTAAVHKRSPSIAITKGTFEVQSLLHWSEKDNLIFFTSNARSSNALHVYAVKSTGGNPICVTCDLTNSRGEHQNYFSAEFSTSNYVAITDLGPNIPSTCIYKWTFQENTIILEKQMDWDRNGVLQDNLKDVLLPLKEIHEFDIGNSLTGKALVSLPSNIDRSGKTKYPMLVDVYGGPDSYSVIDRFGIDWGTFLTTNQSIIYTKIDGRGSGLRGDKLLHEIYLKFGTVEIYDQIYITNELQKRLPFIDGNRIGIWGWSYGGYAAAMALAKDNSSIFKCAASVAPVTDWTYYDSIYTERFMQTPRKNPSGYKASRLSTLASRFDRKKFFLIHGTLDDNVHYQQAMILAKNLERADIQFKQMSYTDEDHGLTNVRPHLYHSLGKFFSDCFDF